MDTRAVTMTVRGFDGELMPGGRVIATPDLVSSFIDMGASFDPVVWASVIAQVDPVTADCSITVPTSDSFDPPTRWRFQLPTGVTYVTSVPSGATVDLWTLSGEVADWQQLSGGQYWDGRVAVGGKGDPGDPGAQGDQGEQGPPGITPTPRGAYNSGATYAQWDWVNYGGDSWISLQNGNTGHTPVEGAWWTLWVHGSGQVYAGEYRPEDYANFTDAVDAVNAAGGGVLVVSGTIPVAASKIVPASVAIRRTGRGFLNIAAGQTVTINGVVDSPRVQLFGGAGKAVFGGFQTQDECKAEWFGAKGDCTWNQGSGSGASSVAAAAALDAIPSWGGMDLTFGAGVFRFDATWGPIYTTNGGKRQANIRIRGTGDRIGGTTSPTGQTTTFLWDSTTSTYGNGSNPGVILRVHAREVSVENITFGPCNGRTLFACVDIDRDPLDTTGNTCTKNRFIDCHFTSGAGEGKTGTLTHGVQIAAGNYVNCDQMLFRDCQFSYHTEAGFYSPNTTWQSKEHWFEHCEFTAGKYAVRMTTGSANFMDPHFYSQTVTAVRIDSSLDSLSFYGIESEGCKQLLSCGLANGSVGFYGGRIACDAVTVDPATAQDSFIYAGGAHVSMYGLRFDGSQHAGFGGMYSLTCIGTNLPNLDPLQFNSQAIGIKHWRMNCAGLSPTVGDLVPLQDLWTGSNNNGLAPGLTMTGPLLVDSPTAHPFAITNNPPDGSQARSTASATGGALLAGHFYQYAVTYVTATGETQSAGIVNIPTPGTAGVSPNTCSIAITGIPKGPPGTTDRKLYRYGPDGSPVWKVRTIAGNNATTFTDTDAGWSASGGTPGSDTSGLTAMQVGMLSTGALRVAPDTGTAFGISDHVAISWGGAVRYMPLQSAPGALISGGGSYTPPPQPKSVVRDSAANTTLDPAVEGAIRATATGLTITLPDPDSVLGEVFGVANSGAGGSTSVVASGGDLLAGDSPYVLQDAHASALFHAAAGAYIVY